MDDDTDCSSSSDYCEASSSSTDSNADPPKGSSITTAELREFNQLKRHMSMWKPSGQEQVLPADFFAGKEWRSIIEMTAASIAHQERMEGPVEKEKLDEIHSRTTESLLELFSCLFMMCQDELEKKAPMEEEPIIFTKRLRWRKKHESALYELQAKHHDKVRRKKQAMFASDRVFAGASEAGWPEKVMERAYSRILLLDSKK